MFSTFDEFVNVFDKITKNYNCMVINNKIQTSNIDEKIFWYKAKI